MKYFTKYIIGFLLVTLATVSVVSAEDAREADRQAREKYQTAQNAYMSEVNFYKNARQQFQTVKEKYRKSKKTEDGESLETEAKTLLKSMIRVTIKKLEAIRNKPAHLRGISEVERQSLLAEIDEDINWLKQKEQNIDSATPEQIREEAKAVKEYWKNVRITLKRVTGQLLAARINFIINKADSASQKIAVKIEQLKSAGHDTSSLEAQLGDFDDKVNLAESKYSAAKEKFQSISTVEKADNLFKQGHQFIKEANAYVREAHKILVNIVKDIKSTTGAVSTGETE
ncbi:MAG: hypothetical protein ABH919_04165 [bacterium]